MRERQQSEGAARGQGAEQKKSSEAATERKFRIALMLYAGLAALSWWVVGPGTILVNGKPVELRLMPLVVIGGLALKTVLARQADRIRHGEDR